MSGGTAVLDSGVTLKYRTVLEPFLKSSAFLPMGTVFHASGNAMQHFIGDRLARSYFGYEMTVSPGAGPDSRQVSFGPLPMSEGMRNGLEAVAGDLPLIPAPLPRYPPPQVVYDGDTIALDLMVSPNGRERIVDYIQFVFGPKSSQPLAAAAAEPRDFTIDDGPVRFSPDRTEVLIDGRKLPGAVVLLPAKGGATLWFYFPGRGRYILSLAPHDGFVKAGAVRGDAVSFRADGRQYEIRLGTPIAGSERAWNLYVLRDPQYLPASSLVNQIVGSADRLDNLLRKP